MYLQLCVVCIEHRVRPGGYIPVDGIVSHGAGFVNEAQMTGESMPEMKQVRSLCAFALSAYS